MGFATPAAVLSKWQTIQQKIIAPLTTSSFIQEFGDAPFALKMIACTVMHDAVDILDGTIKEVKTSNALSMEDRIILFKEMLADFYTVLLGWIKNIMPEDALRYNSDWPLYAYLEQMDALYKNIMEKSDDQSMFQRSENFSVNAAMLGTRTAFERHFPESAEDIFMLIHQNTLVAIAGAMKSMLSSAPIAELIYLPPFLETCRETLASNRQRDMQFIGITYTSDSIILSFNIPLNNHSGACRLIYNTITNECLCEVQFLGQARERWSKVAALARISCELSELLLEQEVIFEEKAGIVLWRWVVEKENQLSTIINYIEIMSDISFGKNLNIYDLYNLYKGSGDKKAAIKKIINEYNKKNNKPFPVEVED